MPPISTFEGTSLQIRQVISLLLLLHLLKLVALALRSAHLADPAPHWVRGSNQTGYWSYIQLEANKNLKVDQVESENLFRRDTNHTYNWRQIRIWNLMGSICMRSTICTQGSGCCKEGFVCYQGFGRGWIGRSRWRFSRYSMARGFAISNKLQADTNRKLNGTVVLGGANFLESAVTYTSILEIAEIPRAFLLQIIANHEFTAPAETQTDGIPPVLTHNTRVQQTSSTTPNCLRNLALLRRAGFCHYLRNPNPKIWSFIQRSATLTWWNSPTLTEQIYGLDRSVLDKAELGYIPLECGFDFVGQTKRALDNKNGLNWSQ